MRGPVGGKGPESASGMKRGEGGNENTSAGILGVTSAVVVVARSPMANRPHPRLSAQNS